MKRRLSWLLPLAHFLIDLAIVAAWDFHVHEENLQRPRQIAYVQEEAGVGVFDPQFIAPPAGAIIIVFGTAPVGVPVAILFHGRFQTAGRFIDAVWFVTHEVFSAALWWFVGRWLSSAATRWRYITGTYLGINVAIPAIVSVGADGGAPGVLLICWIIVAAWLIVDGVLWMAGRHG